ncbi:MAG: peptide ABC transporter substrate-binding protein, partial [Chlamydiia bacterium]|nr:peptide ABC transporter substrate-binding protein [Chlamydiia bacterium]
DLPHVLIDLDLHTPKKIFFLVYLCQITDTVGKLATQFAAHANVEVTCQFNEKFKNAFREGLILKVELQHFPDASFVEKRFEVSNLLEKILGPFRDVNGGLLEHIEKNYQALAHSFAEVPSDLRSFFDSMTPEDERATCPPTLIKTLFLTAQKVEKELVIEEDAWVGAMIKIDDPKLKKTLSKAFSKARFALANAPSGAIFISYLHHPTAEEVSQFKTLIANYLKELKSKEDPTRILRLCTTARFTSFDPRTGTEEETSYLHKMLFEGLTRIDPSGKPEPAIAKKIEISPDGKCYTFRLRKSKWSNGMPLTAHDFLYSWQMILTRKDLAPLSYLFDSIQNAQKIKEGLLPLSEFGATAPDNHTLVVHLQSPCVPFLEICALSLFSPICQQVDEKEPSWSLSQGEDYVCNGPFTLESKDDAGGLILRKNLLYWENARVNLNKVTIPFVSHEEGKRLFLKKEVDAFLFYQYPDLQEKRDSTFNLFRGVTNKVFLSFNCQVPPFHNKKVRQAIAFAIDRGKILKSFIRKARPTTSFFSSFTYPANHQESGCIENIEQAQRLLIQAIVEDPDVRNTFFDQTILVLDGVSELPWVLCNYLNDVLGLRWKPIIKKVNDSNTCFQSKKPFQALLSGWINRTSDAGYFLEIFSLPNNFANTTNWTHPLMQSIIAKTKIAQCQKEKMELFQEGERLLTEEMPMVPLFDVEYPTLSHPYVKGIYGNHLQKFDLRFATKSQESNV